MQVTMHDDTKWRMLAHAVLQHTRDSRASVRSAALWILQQLFSTIGEPFLVLLPETVQTLALCACCVTCAHCVTGLTDILPLRAA